MTRPASAFPSKAAPAATTTAAVLAAPGRFELRSGPAAEPAPGQVRVRLQSCGVCASSIPVWEGREWFTYPQPAGSPGHEGTGVIDAVGEGVDESRIGERVALLSYHAFATHDAASAACAVPLPPELEGRHFPGEAIGCAMNIFARSGIALGSSVAIVGVGFIGALLVQLAARAGARVVALSHRPCSLALASRMGAVESVSTQDEHDAVRRASDAGQGLFDVAIECTGLAGPLDLAAQLVRERGRLVIAGYHQDGRRSIDMQLWNWRGMDVINAHERDAAEYVRGIREGAAAVAAGRLDPDELYTHVYPLSRIEEAFRAAAGRPEGFVKAVVNLEG
ncbi:MAG TPA: zinc-binding dehydrogenase [Phycisphaerales bacterium]|nr:zinc-binding dehydrogenase [Phycisphaerales bacterium]